MFEPFQFVQQTQTTCCCHLRRIHGVFVVDGWVWRMLTATVRINNNLSLRLRNVTHRSDKNQRLMKENTPLCLLVDKVSRPFSWSLMLSLNLSLPLHQTGFRAGGGGGGLVATATCLPFQSYPAVCGREREEVLMGQKMIKERVREKKSLSVH